MQTRLNKGRRGHSSHDADDAHWRRELNDSPEIRLSEFFYVVHNDLTILDNAHTKVAVVLRKHFVYNALLSGIINKSFGLDFLSK